MSTPTTMNDLGVAIGATTKPTKERRTVRVDLNKFFVYTETGRKPIGIVTRYVENTGARTPSGGKYVSRRLTVRFPDDERQWVGQFKSGEHRFVILRPIGDD